MLDRRIVSDDLADGGVPTAKLADLAVTSAKIATSVPVADPDRDAAAYFDVISVLDAEQTNMTAQTTGQALFAYFTAPRSFTVDAIEFCSRSTAASGLTLCRFGLFTTDASGNLTACVARSANDTALFAAANTKYLKAFDTTGGFPATYGIVKGTKYALGELQVGTTIATLLGVNTLSAINTGARRRSSIKGGLSDFDGSAINTVVDDGRVPWCSLRKV